ncbi:serine hydrolase [Flavobacterium antarcticum]|uniref:serine hydrolase domain-containing protein n=1 Tax=Flavobacterium antarcticum TaxID=271155 RepID=UPI0003B70B81|nr:serine hydrolase [Flavobacterium antarcticum]
MNKLYFIYFLCFGLLTGNAQVTTIISKEIIHSPKIHDASTLKQVLDLKNIAHSYLNMQEYFPSKTVAKAAKPFLFPRVKNSVLPTDFSHKGTKYNTEKFIDSSYTQGLIWIQNDTIQYENYWRGQKEDIKHISWSMSKSYVSALFGIAIDEGYIKSINQTVDEYLPELKSSGYNGVKIKDVLQMASGIGFNEDYSDPNADINVYWNGFVSGKSQDKFAKTLVNQRPPGTYNQYVSINTHVLAMIIVKATGRSLTDYLQEKIWKKIGTEYDAYWLVDGEGMEMALGGLNACLRDYAKLGQLYLNKGKYNGEQIIPTAWIESSVRATEKHLLPATNGGTGYGYQWWIPFGSEGEFMAIGIFNQYIYINPTTKTIIVKNSANQNYYDSSNPYCSSNVHLALFRKLAHSTFSKKSATLKSK